MSSAPAGHRPHFGVLRTIALYKLLKVLLLLLAAYGETRLHDTILTSKILSWAAERPMGFEHRLVAEALKWFSGLPEERIHQLRFVTLVYAAVFAVEGVGLWLERRWAEWLTVIVTASLVPIEVWEIYHRPNLGKVAVLVGNIAIVAYLGWHVSKRAGRGPTARLEPAISRKVK